MSSSGSLSMSISGDESSSFEAISSIETSCSETYLSQVDGVKQLKRSRFGEVHVWKQLKNIGSGGNGNVFLLERESDRVLRVCKVQRRSRYDLLEEEILRHILPTHDRIVKFHETIIHASTAQLYFDYYPGGDLDGLIKHYREEYAQIPESFIWHVLLQLSEALAFCHHRFDRRQLCAPPHPSEFQAVIHGDVKPANVFLGPPDERLRGYPSLVLGDFGFARLTPSHVMGTWLFQPPEMPMTSMKADVYALGAVMHALAHNGMAPIGPWPDWIPKTSDGWDSWILNPASRQPMPLFHQYSIELHNLVMAALAPNPCERYSSLEVLWGAIDEVELGVASDDIFEPLLPMKGQTDNGSAGSENVVKHLVVRSFEGNDSRGDDIEADTEACYKAREAQEDCVC